jgi:hypothetical protein
MFEGFKWPTFHWGGSSPVNFAGLRLPVIGGTRNTPPPTPYSGSVNAFASTHPKTGDTSIPWHAIAAATQQQSQSAIPTGPPIESYVDPYAAFDPEKMAAREFDPQLALIAQMEKQAKGSYGKAGKDIGAGWDLIAKAISGREKGIKGEYTGMGRAGAAAFGNVSSTSDKSLDAARQEIINNAKAAGSSMESIAPLLAKLAMSKSEIGSQARSLGANQAAFNSQMGENTVNQNRVSADEAKWGGINARADFATRLQSALQDLGNRRLSTKAAEGAAANKYGMEITGARVGAKNAWDQLQMAQAGQALSLAKAEASASKTSAPKPIDTTKLTPTEYLAYLTKIQYPNVGVDTQQRAAQAIQDTIIHGAKWANAKDFADQVLARNPHSRGAGGDARQLAQIAQDYYKKLVGDANKPYSK